MVGEGDGRREGGGPDAVLVTLNQTVQSSALY